MDTLYGMSLPLGAHPTLPLGGQEAVDYSQYGGPTPEAIAAERERNQQAQAVAQPPVQQAVPPQQAPAIPSMDWPTYLSTVGGDPAKAYDNYLNSDAPAMWESMGATPDQVKQAQALFAQQVPKPQPAQGVLSNAYGALTQAYRQTKGEMAAGGAVATQNVEKLAQLAKEQAGEEALTPEALKRWQKTGGLMWNDLGKTAQNMLKEPEGAVDAALQAVASFVPFIASGIAGGVAGSIVPGVGNIAGSAAAMGLTAADLAAGGTALSHIRKGLQEDGVDVNNVPAVKQWIEANGEKVFGDAWKAAGTEGAITALTMGVAGKMGAAVTRGLTEAGQVGVAEATARAAGVEATRIGTATAASLRAAQRLPAAAKVATEVGGLGGAGVAGAYAAGDTPEANDVITQSLAMLIPSLFHMRGEFKAAREVGVVKRAAAVPEKPPSTKEEVEPTEEEFTGKPAESPAAAPPSEPPARTVREPEPFSEEELQATYQRMAETRLDDEVEVRKALGLPETTKAGGLRKIVGADEVRAVVDAKTPEEKIAALEAVAERHGQKGGNPDVAERAQAKADELRKLEPATEDEVVDNATAVQLARDVIQDAVNEHAQEVAATVQAEVKGRQAERAAATPSVPDIPEGTAPAAIAPVSAAPGLPPAGGRTATGKRKTGLKQNAPVQQGAGGEAEGRPADRTGAGVNQEVPGQAVAPVPERGQPARVAGAGGAAVTGRPSGALRVAERKGLNEPADVGLRLSIKSRSMLEQKALLKELADQGINVKKSYFKQGEIEFTTPEDKAKAEAYLAEKQANIDKVAAALTSRAADVVPAKGLTKEAVKAHSDAYYVRKMIDEMGFDRNTAKELYNEDPAHWRDQVEQETTKGKVKEPLKKSDVEAAVKAADETRVSKDAADATVAIVHPPLSPEFVRGLREGNVVAGQALNYLAARSNNPLTRLLARQLREILGNVAIPIKLVDFLRDRDGNYARGLYKRWLVESDPYNTYQHGHIYLDSERGVTEKTLLHELVHAATIRALEHPVTAVQQFVATRMKNIFKQAQDAGLKTDEHYGMTNPSEFVAEAWANLKFQDALDGIKYRDPMGGSNVKIPTLWQAFKNVVADMLAQLRGGQRDQGPMSLLHAAIVHSADLFDADVPVYKKPPGKYEHFDVKESADREKKTEDVFAKTPHDAILGHDENQDRTHIAYRNDKNNTYNLYDVTPENPKGDPDTKRPGLTAEQVRAALQEQGSTPLEATSKDFREEPQNTRSQLNGWKDGARQFAAFKQADGTWNVYKGDDLSDRGQRGAPEKFKDYDAVMKEYGKGGYLKTEAQDRARERDNQPRDMVTYQGPGKLNLNWWDWTAPVKYLAAQMEQQLGKLPDYMRPDIPALLKTSWINRDVRTMERDEWNPLRDAGRKLLKEHNVKGDQFDKDLTMLVSEERSRTKLGQQDYQNLPELTAKLTRNLDAARAHLDSLDPSYLAAMKDYARQLKTFANKTVDNAVDFGLMPADRATAIKSAYEFYVPIQKGNRTSTGKRATGASAESEHPLARLLDQRRSTTMRGYDNMEKRAVYEAALAYNIVKPDGSKMFDIAPILKYGFDKDGLVTTVLDPLVMDSKALAVMIDGKPYRIAIHDDAFLNALKDTNTPKLAAMKGIFHGAAVFNALYGGLKTAASPVFAVKNFIRDAATALAQNDPRISTGRLALSLVEPKVWLAALHDAFEVGRDKPGGRHGPIADFAAKVRDAGGLIDRRAAYGLDAVVDDVNSSIDPAWLARLPAAVKKQFSIEHGAISKPITVWTKTLENATRMAVFDAAKKSGLSDNDAAVQAKTTTVNFEPKGAYAGVINPLYVFANAKLQGTRTYAEKLGLTGLRGGNFSQRLQRGNRRTQIATGLGLFVGMLAAKYGYDTSEKDKDGRSTFGKLSDYQKDDYLTVKSGGFSLPLPPELTWSYILGQSIVDAMMNDRWADPAMRQQKAAIRFGSAMAQTFVPGGTSMSDPVSDTQGGTADYWRRLMTPTPMAMVSDIAMNKTTFGSPIVTGQKPSVPQYATNAANYPTAAAFAKGIHDTTGVNVAPQVLKYLTDQWVKPQVDVYNSIFGGPETTVTGQPKQGVWERTFHQTASPFTDRQDLQEIKDRVTANTYDPLHRGKMPQLQMFEQNDKQVSAAMKGWDKMTPEQKQRASDRAATIRGNTLKRYQQAIQQAEGAQ